MVRPAPPCPHPILIIHEVPGPARATSCASRAFDRKSSSRHILGLSSYVRQSYKDRPGCGQAGRSFPHPGADRDDPHHSRLSTSTGRATVPQGGLTDRPRRAIRDSGQRGGTARDQSQHDHRRRRDRDRHHPGLHLRPVRWSRRPAACRYHHYPACSLDHADDPTGDDGPGAAVAASLFRPGGRLQPGAPAGGLKRPCRAPSARLPRPPDGDGAPGLHGPAGRPPRDEP